MAITELALLRLKSPGDRTGHVEWIVHIDINPREAKTHERIPLDAPMIAIRRYFLTMGQRDAFLQLFHVIKGRPLTIIALRTLQGGLRMELRETTAGGQGNREFVLFSGWDDVTVNGWVEESGFEEFVREALAGTDIKHVGLWEGTDRPEEEGSC
ncbi:hypothetical protein EYZ11_011129 [Aspergillus tanneri]|uniref:Uncharacterized protein n=1 Tax=Aspergillus tanneri TaxID=1220188 RepID=A0A4S3J5R5_9EURO|nr:hypothetical protein EYZ11_011129 [Aspergillus tanneri]